MKIKDSIVKWREQIRNLTEKMSKFESNAESVHEEIKALKEQVETLAKITEEMTDTLLALIKLQEGD